MQIHMVVKEWKEFDDLLHSNYMPFLSKVTAEALVTDLMMNLTEEEERLYVTYSVETHNVADA